MPRFILFTVPDRCLLPGGFPAGPFLFFGSYFFGKLFLRCLRRYSPPLEIIPCRIGGPFGGILVLLLSLYILSLVVFSEFQLSLTHHEPMGPTHGHKDPPFSLLLAWPFASTNPLARSVAWPTLRYPFPWFGQPLFYRRLLNNRTAGFPNGPRISVMTLSRPFFHPFLIPPPLTFFCSQVATSPNLFVFCPPP